MFWKSLLANITLHADADTPPPLWLGARSSKAFIAAVITFAIFVDQWVFAVIVPVMPFTLHAQVGIAESDVQTWISLLLAVYGIACALTSPLWGWLVDKVPSRRTPFMASLLVIFGSVIMIWLGRSIAVQVLARVLQGVATCMVWVTGLAMLGDTVGEKEIGKYSGYLGMGMMVGTCIAPLVGGVALAKVGPSAVYGITLGLVGLDILARLVVIERKHAAQWLPAIQDELDRRSSAAALPLTAPRTPSATSSASLETKDLGNTSTESLAHKESTTTTSTTVPPSPPPKPKARAAIVLLLRSRRLHAVCFATIVQGAIFAGLESVLPLQTAAQFGWDSIGGGLVFLPLTIPAFLGPLIGKTADRHGTRWLISVSFLAMTPLGVCLRFVDMNTLGDKVLLCALLTVMGLCYTATLDPIMAEMMYIIELKARGAPDVLGDARKAYAQTFALFNFAWSAGNTVGPLLFGLIRGREGWATMSWVLGLVCGVTAIPTFLWCNGWYFGKGQKGRVRSEAS